ncbi:restriction endonuclease subunit S [Mesorhizobium sp. M0482]|uniref:restriction endonuclease subunit S n=1 Tax=Mesorhizobium sp. M0482 TaxID=2956948 RepID=UPI00333AF655
MIDGLHPYPEINPSGVEWLPSLPVGWEIHRAKYSFQEADDWSETGDEELLSVSHKTGVTPRSQKNITMFMAESYAGHKVCRPGDIVVNTMWAWMAAIGVSRHIGIVSPAYGIYRPRNTNRFEPKYLDYLLRTEVYRAEYLRSSRGITTSRLRLYPPDFLNIPFVQPPLEEQRLIVRFLDWHGGQTTKLIREKKKIIALLNEQKQAIIHRAVTRGLDPNVRLKPSGVSWVAEIPEHWQMLPNRAFLKKRKLLVGEAHHDFQLLSLTKQGVIVRDVDSGKGKFSADMGTSQVVNAGDIIFCLFDIPETPRTVGLSLHAGMITGAYTVFSFSGRVDPNFIELFYIAMDDRKLLGPLYTGLRNTIAPSRFIGVKTPVPPLQEQISIVQAVQATTAEMNATISTIEKEVSLIQEFQTRLIADVVTGKLDVRAAAAKLPEITEFEPIDDLAEDDDPDEALYDAENEEVAA